MDKKKLCLFAVKFVLGCLKETENKRKEAGDGLFKKEIKLSVGTCDFVHLFCKIVGTFVT